MYCKRFAATLFLLVGCKSSGPPVTAPQRTAVLRFENLSSSGADDWEGRALSELLKRGFRADQMPRSASPAPGVSSERLAAIEAGATRLIYGFYTARSVPDDGTLSATAMAEDPATQKITEPFHVTGSVAAVADAIAKRFGGFGAIPKISAGALKEYSMASDMTGADAIAHYGAALQVDPNFGLAYLGLTEAATMVNDAAMAKAALTRAAARSSNFTEQDRADLQLQTANLNRDGGARIQALRAKLALNREDTVTLRALADTEMQTRMAGGAEKHYSDLASRAPDDANLRNLLAYACLGAGDEGGARAAAAAFRTLRPQDPNAFDTQGDVELAFGHFGEAEKIYLASPDPHFQLESPTWKAARARLYAGDVAGATTLFERHRKALASAGNAASDYRAAEWLYLTGRQAEAIAAMSTLAAKNILPELRGAAYTQAAIWAIAQRDPARAIQLSEQALHPKSGGTNLTAALARFLAQPTAAPAEWQRRADASFRGANVAEVKRLALGLALFVSNAPRDALPVWKQVYESTPVGDSLPVYLYGWCLLQTGHVAESRSPFLLNPVPSPTIAPSFEALYVPALFEWRKSSLRQ